MKYLLLAELGYEVAQSNAAYIKAELEAYLVMNISQVRTSHDGERRLNLPRRVKRTVRPNQ